MNFKNWLFFTLIIILGNVSCKKNANPNPHPGLIPESAVINDPAVDVYIAGTRNDGQSIYWKNGISTVLGAGSVSAIAVIGHDIYVAGRAAGLNNNINAVYWKNGVINYLNGADGAASAIAVIGTDVYVAGTTQGSEQTVATYWKNGKETVLAGGADFFGSAATALTLSGADVYIAGYTHDANDNYMATYWKNGVAVYLSNTVTNGIANAIAVNGTNVFIAGSSASFPLSLSDDTATAAACWENGLALNLPQNSTASGANSIAVSGNDLYMAGFTKDVNGNFLTTYWKNGVAVKMPLLNSSYSIYTPAALAVQGNDIYVTGVIGNYPGYWKNGTPFQLGQTGGTSFLSVATAITVVPK